MKLTAERGTPVYVNPAHVVTIEPAMDEKGCLVIGVTALLLDLFPVGPGQFVTIRVRGSLDDTISALFDLEGGPAEPPIVPGPTLVRG